MRVVRRVAGSGLLALLLLVMLGIFAFGCADSTETDPEDGDGNTDGDSDGDDSDGDDSDGDEDGDDPDGDEPDGDSDGDAGGDGDSDEPPLSTPRLYRLDAAPTGGWPEVLAMEGDFVLENDLIRVVIQAPENPPRSWLPSPGGIIDADIRRAEGEVSGDALNEISPMPALLRAFCPQSSEIVADGSDGGEAILRMNGTDCGIELIDFVLPMPQLNAQVEMEYRLAPDSRAVMIQTTITNTDQMRTISMGDGLVWSNRARVLTPGLGFGLEGLTGLGAFPYQLAMTDRVAYALASDEGGIKVPLDQAYILPFIGKDERVQPNKSLTYRRWLAVGANAEDVRDFLAERAGETRYPVTVTLDGDLSGLLEAEAWLVVTQDGKALTALPITGDTLTLRLADGDYGVYVEQAGRPQVDEAFQVSGGAFSLSLTIPETGRLSVSIGETGGSDALPCRVSLHPAGSPNAILTLWYTPDGRGTWWVLPGEYQVVVSRGFEYSILRETVTIVSGQTYSIEGNLTRVVDTEGWLVGDMHMHTERSIDAVVPVYTRVVEMAAVGLELSPITDHDLVTDLEPVVEELGLSDWLRTVPGNEISPPWAHTNVYPVTDVAERSMYFGLPISKGYDTQGRFLGRREMPDTWAFAREVYQAGIVQINHPRGGSSTFFDAIRFKPEEGVAAHDPEIFDGSADAVELINGGNITQGFVVLKDWYSMLNEGYPITGVASSDSHTSGNPGECRSWVRVGADAPHDVTLDEWVDAIKGMRVVSGCGPFVTAQIGDTEIGGTHQQASPHTLSIRVQAPGWMPVDWVKVIVNGATLDTITLPDRGDAPLNFTTDVVLPPQTGDFWVVVLAGAPEKRLAPLYPGTGILTITNPIFVDPDSNGYEAPGFPLVREL